MSPQEDRAPTVAPEVDPDAPPPRKAGRPSLSGEGGSPMIQFRVPREKAEIVAARAKQDGVSLSQLGRIALDRYLEAS